jgi:hypothetical protein
LPISRTLLPIGSGNIWKAVRFSISLDMAGEPKKTAANTGRSDRTNAHIYRNSSSLRPVEIAFPFSSGMKSGSLFQIPERKVYH